MQINNKLGFPCDSAGKESACNAGDLGLIPGLGRSSGEGKGYLLRYSGLENSMDCIVHELPELYMTERLSLLGFPDSSVGKESACNAGDPSLIPGLGKFNGEGIGYPLQYSGLENSMDCVVHGVAKSWTQLSDFHFHTLQKKYRNIIL